MKALLLVLPLLALSASPFAFADFNGTWGGDATLSDSNGQQAATDPVSVEIVQDAQTLAISWFQTSFEIKGTELWAFGHQVGTLTDAELTLHLVDELTTGDIWDLKLTHNADATLQYSDKYSYGAKPGYWDSVQSTLSQQRSGGRAPRLR
jgi:hypothetical protein